MLPVLVDTVPTDPGWLFELKWDGVRVLAIRKGGRVELWSRNRLPLARQYPEIAAAVAALAALRGAARGRPRARLPVRGVRRSSATLRV